jgi:thioredoxin-related protein
MDTVTYPNEEVVHEITEYFIPLKMECDFKRPTGMMQKYHVRWTPTLLFLESDGRPRFHTVGYMPPEELVARLELVRIMEEFDRGRLQAASERLREIANRFPTTHAAPQAIYYEGVALYLKTHNAKYLKKIFVKLNERHPESLWAKKASPYAEIPD